MRTLALFTILGALAAPAAARAEETARTDLEQVRLGDFIYGPKVDLEDLKGKVVLVEFWGFK